MSVKRQATTELNHDNWDQDDPSEHEEMGSFKVAPKEVLEKRVIRTAKRRSQISAAEEPKKSVFSGFGGFNKTQPSSFDFLAKLTNGNKPANGSSTTSETTVTSSLFGNKTASPGGLFGAPTSTTPTKSTFGASPLQTSSPFVMTSTKSDAGASVGTKADSTVSDTNKLQPVTSSADSVNKSTEPVATSTSTTGVSSNNANVNKLLFTTSTNTSPFKTQTVTTSSKSSQSSFPPVPTNSSGDNEDVDNDDKKMKYYSKLKGLNQSVSAWIKKHVDQTPLCILTPIFKDYNKYLQEIQEEYQGGSGSDSDSDSDDDDKESKSTDTNSQTTTISTGSSLFSSTSNTKSSGTKDSGTDKTSQFSFGITNTVTPVPTNITFTFGSTFTPSTVSPFLSTTNTTSASPGAAPFSFGNGKPFSFSPSSIQQNAETNKTENEDEDEPPKVEFTPIAEENSVYDKKCKIFVKKDGNFADKGVGTLYIKKIEESGKHQLLVRANTNLGTVLLNLVLGSSIPTQRMGKNNVMLVCIPTPDAKPPPTPVLIRVKTGEEADELLETLNKYKK